MVKIKEALVFVETTGERWVESDVHIVLGEIYIGLSQPGNAEAEFHKALEISRQQGARIWEIRGATRLAQLWSLQGQNVRARELLTPLYNRCKEGNASADMLEAKAVLDTLATAG